MRRVSLLFLSALALSSCVDKHEELAVFNDLEFDVALSRCVSEGITTDSVLLSSGETKSIRPGAACIIFGSAPAERTLGGSARPRTLLRLLEHP